MPVYHFKAPGTHNGVTVVLEAKNRDEANQKIRQIQGSNTNFICFRWEPGTLDEYMGERFPERMNRRWKARMKDHWKKSHRPTQEEPQFI